MTSTKQTVSRRAFLAGGGTAFGLAVIGPTPALAAGHGRGTLDGIWHTDGYGTTVSITGGRARIFQTTLISRVEAEPMRRVGAGRFVGTDDAFTMTLGPGPDRASYYAVSAVGFRQRLGHECLLLPRCG
jgi:hypothetical protein